jgi:hypothetical protein
MLRRGFIVVLSLLAISCTEINDAVKEAKNQTPPPPKDNYIILLDLSDRILEDNQQQIGKDLTAIKNIYGFFKSNLNKKDPSHLYYALNDKLKVLIAPQKSTPRKLYDASDLLRLDLSAEQPEKRSKLVQESEKKFNTVLPDVYRQALVSKRTSDYAGADIWKYFNEDLADDLDKDAHNTLFIITDGYLDFEKTEDRPNLNNRFTSCAKIINTLKTHADWNSRFDNEDYGLMSVTKKFPNLRVVLLQMSPSQEWPEEYTLLTKIWSKWFKEMSIDTFSFIKNDNNGEVTESLGKFIDVKPVGNVAPVAWTAIELPDSNATAQKNSISLDKKKEPAEIILSAQPIKKKDELVKTASAHANDSAAVRNLTAKRPNKQKEQVSFGPAY